MDRLSNPNLFLTVANPRRKWLCWLLTSGLAVAGLAGCASISSFQQVGKRKDVPPEFRQRVGVHVQEGIERISYYGSASNDVSDLMVFHLQQILPFNVQTALHGIFENVELAEPGPKAAFKTPGLAGYFDIKISNVRYDYPEANRPVYRAEARLQVEFKTPQNEIIWTRMFEGTGTSYSDASVSITDFGKGASSAVESAFQNAVDEMGDGVLQSEGLREYFRMRGGQGAP